MASPQTLPNDPALTGPVDKEAREKKHRVLGKEGTRAKVRGTSTQSLNAGLNRMPLARAQFERAVCCTYWSAFPERLCPARRTLPGKPGRREPRQRPGGTGVGRWRFLPAPTPRAKTGARCLALLPALEPRKSGLEPTGCGGIWVQSTGSPLAFPQPAGSRGLESRRSIHSRSPRRAGCRARDAPPALHPRGDGDSGPTTPFPVPVEGQGSRAAPRSPALPSEPRNPSEPCSQSPPCPRRQTPGTHCLSVAR